MKKDILYKRAAIVLAAFILGLSGCVNEKSTEQYTEQDFTVWSAPATSKILSDKEESIYADIATDTIELYAARNEYETGQIIVSAEKELYLTVELSDLVNKENNTVIGKENFSVYIQKYVFLTRNYHGNGAPTGEYPDAIVPQSNAVTYGLNKVGKNKNGGAWLEFFIPEDAVQGLYGGTATVKVGNMSKTVGVSLRVYDVLLPDETTSKSWFTVNEHLRKEFELDSSAEMQDKYADFFLKHRLNADFSFVTEDGDYTNFAEKALEYDRKGNRTIAVQGGMTTLNGYGCFNPETVTKSLEALAVTGLENGVDLNEKAVLYDWPIDEPFYVTYTGAHIQHNIDLFDSVIGELATRLSEDPRFDTELGAKIIESIRKTPHIITDYYGNEFRMTEPMKNEDGTLFTYEGKNVCLAPKFDDYNTEEQRAQYDLIAGSEKWWYGCNTPNAPYPSYHIDDTLVSANSIGWMMAQYGVTGNLYWCTNYYMLNNVNAEDPYASIDSGSGANGDGLLIYPGKPYGVDGPVSSLRMSAILDGNEDYELIRLLKDCYEKAGCDASSIIGFFTDSVYQGTEMIGEASAFESARKTLLELLEAALSPSKLMISSVTTEIDEDGMNRYSFTVRAESGSEVTLNGEKYESFDGTASVNCMMDKEENYFEAKAVSDGVTSEIRLYLGKKQISLAAESFTEEDFGGNYENVTLIDGAWRFTFKEGEDSRLSLLHESISEIDADTESYKIDLKYLGTTDAAYQVYVTYTGFGKVQLLSGILSAGENTIDLDMFPTVNWSNKGKVTEIEIKIAGGSPVEILKVIA